MTAAMIRLLLVLAVGVWIGWALHGSQDEPVTFDRPIARTDDNLARIDSAGQAIGAVAPAVFKRGRRAATLVWGEACGGRVQIRTGRLKLLETMAESAWAYDPRLPLDSHRYRRCSIIVNVRRVFSRARLCATIVHEWGHLTGHGHVKNRRSIMYPSLTSQNFPDVCR